ncbi:MAG TPA: ABC transporter ATP-binding protein [Steroidobacteraceae bacterium]|nr:ABC transporter ATP-binding protein [Steroidobacteraceae bacterium]
MIVHLDNISKKYGRFDALRGLSLRVPAGSVFALFGANGAGKTTTIKMLMNLIEPTAGDATVLGVNTRALSPKELAQIGYVSENQVMPGRMSVAAYIHYLRPYYPTWDRALESQLLGKLRLPPERRIKDLSHGMRMKMALACALPFRPRVLVLDEPLSGLDPLVRDEFMEALTLQAGETTVLISSHELAEIEAITTHVAFLDRGTLLFQETKADLKARVREVQVTLDGAAHIPAMAPPQWLGISAAGNILSFVDIQYSECDLAARIAALLGSVRHIEAKPVALRSVYTTLARAVRDEEVPK